MNRIVIAVSLASVLAACGRGAPAERMEKMVAWKVDDALDDLDATPQQRTQVEALSKKFVADVKPVLAQGEGTRDALVAEWKKSEPDATKVHAVIDGQLDAVKALVHSVADSALEVHRLLTPAQRDDVTKRLEKHSGAHARR
ncbi:MAG: Spy/CpxP family protein refolding chaperone [Myxococcaceae bacterium]|nr:Spy/CpxP family protein refolding chaperone [Myxococcaceae bacterium]